MLGVSVDTRREYTVSEFSHRLDYATRKFFRSWGTPEQAQESSEQSVRAERYNRLWDLYQGTAFSDMEAWAQYRRAYGLYRQTRLIWDHVHSIVEFYAAHVYPGSLAADGLYLPDGVPNAIPLAKDTDPQLAAAIGQLWTWWNFQEAKNMIVRYTAALGEFLVEIKDDPTRGKVLLDFVWPAYVRDIRLDEVGNIVSYVLQYQAFDKDTNRYFVYRKEVDKEVVRTFRDNEPFDYTAYDVGQLETGEPSYGLDREFLPDSQRGFERENPYGFVPAVWFRHVRTLGSRGEPAIWSTQAELDEVNSLFSHMIDKAHISLRAPIVVSGNIAPNALKQALNNMVGTVKRTFTEDLSDQYNDRELLNVLQGPSGTEVSTIELKISEAAEAIDRMIAGIERKCPEVTFYEQLRTMTQITGAAAARLLGDVDHKLRATSSGYDRQLIKLQQMAVAICGWRLNDGDDAWANATDAQLKFAPFDLESYTRGNLDHNIMPRDLVPLTSMERIQVAAAKQKLLPQIPAVKIAEELGYDTDEFEKWEREWEKEQEALAEETMEQRTNQIIAQRPPGAPPGGPQRGASQQNHRPTPAPGGRLVHNGAKGP
jgi:hypothetical protein